MSEPSYDPATGIITMASVGLQSPEAIRQRATTVEVLVTRAKKERGYVRILNFAHDMPVQTGDTAEKAIQQVQRKDMMDDPRDKYAVVITSTLARMQMTRIIGSDKRRAFATDAEARAWLMEE